MYTLELLTFRETDRKKHFFSNEPKKYREKKYPLAPVIKFYLIGLISRLKKKGILFKMFYASSIQ